MIKRHHRNSWSLHFLLLAFFLYSSPLLANNGLLLAVHPYKSSSQLIKAFTPLVDYLGQALGVTVSLDVSPDYDAHIERIGNNMVDIAYMGPAAYVIMVKKYDNKPILARQLVNGNNSFKGKIIKRADNPMTALQSLAGKRFAFGDFSSTMSHLVPRFMLINAGVDASDLSGYQFLGSHDNVALGVLSGDFDAGAVKEEIFYKYKTRGLAEMASTPSVYEHLFVARSDLPDKTIAELRKALTGLSQNPHGMEILGNIKKGVNGLQPADDADYDSLRKVLDVLATHDISP